MNGLASELRGAKGARRRDEDRSGHTGWADFGFDVGDSSARGTGVEFRASAILNESGKTSVDGKTSPYLIRRLPVNSFPDLPDAVAETLTQRGCLIPQTYQAHRPENVIHASFDRAGSSDWAVLCSTHGAWNCWCSLRRRREKP